MDKLALEGNDTYNLPKPVKDTTYNFSFSGLKSHIINLVHNETQRGNEIRKSDLAKSFQITVVDELTRKVELALQNNNVKELIIAGGVSANRYLREEIKKVAEKYHVHLSIPKMEYCTDNAAMIGAAAYPLYKQKKFADFDLNPKSQATIVDQ